MISPMGDLSEPEETDEASLAPCTLSELTGTRAPDESEPARRAEVPSSARAASRADEARSFTCGSTTRTPSDFSLTTKGVPFNNKVECIDRFVAPVHRVGDNAFDFLGGEQNL